MVETVQLELLTIHWQKRPRSHRLEFTGKSTSREPARLLGPVLHRVLEAATPLRQPVEMAFDKLEYFNSSTISVLVQFMNEAKKAQVPLTIHYDAGVKWQALSFDALKRAVATFGGDGIEFVGSRP